MKYYFTLILFIFSGSTTFAANQKNAQLWAKANTAYQQKQYDAAIQLYENILAAEPHNANLYFNLGNAFYRTNKVSDAVLAYERAAYYNPSLIQAADNLVLTKSRIPNYIKESKDIFFVRWWKNATKSTYANLWASLAILSFITLLALIFIRIRNSKNIPEQFYFILPLLTIVLLFFAYTASQNGLYSSKAVIMNTNASMTVLPNNYKGQSLIPEGTTVETEEQKGNWIAVTLPDNRSGWMKLSDLTFVQGTRKK